MSLDTVECCSRELLLLVALFNFASAGLFPIHFEYEIIEDKGISPLFPSNNIEHDLGGTLNKIFDLTKLILGFYYSP